MSRFPDRTVTLIAVIAGLLVFAMAGLGGGPDNLRDVAAIHSLAAQRALHVGLTGRAIIITHVGGAPAMVTILLISVALLAWARRWRDAVSLAAVVLGGRVAIELLKIVINRPRPTFSEYPVEIASLSFPSGHAGNSMITFLALALIAAPKRLRLAAIASAILATVAIGATRPLLGVHWPSDVVGGWAFGIAWVAGLVELSRRWRAKAE